MAMKIGGKYRFDDIFPRHWESFAQSAGLSPAQVKKRVLQLAELIPQKAHTIIKNAAYSGRAYGLLKDIVTLIDGRCRLLKKWNS
jgi:hypothetical protein